MRPPSNALRFKRALLRWFRRAGRTLPWRATRDPYRVLVSEFMLQQTQVSRVAEYYPRFLERYPTVHDLAKAQPRAVREAWEGLGYYRRAENLHKLAREVVQHHAGLVPHRPEVLRTLPGVGPYTAAAVAISRQGSSFGPWTTYTSGAYKQYLVASTATPVGGTTGTTGPATVSAQDRQVSKAWTRLMHSLAFYAPAQRKRMQQARTRIRKAVR